MDGCIKRDREFKQQLIRHVPRAARDLLNTLDRRDGNPFVILGDHGTGHYHDLQKPWRKIRARAGLEDVRVHDLRHTYASVAVINGIDPFMLKEILGHKNLSTTLRYAHLPISFRI